MRLAEDTIIVRVDGQEIILRPTLRAAYRLERQFGGFAALLRQLLDGSLAAMAAIIREAASEPSALPEFLESVERLPMRTGFDSLRASLMSFVCVLAGIEPDQPGDNDASAGMTANEFHNRLFRIGTGWLGWTPEVTWNATISEIRVAYEGRLEMLKAIFGDGKPQVETIPEEAGIAALKVMAATGQNKAA